MCALNNVGKLNVCVVRKV